MSRLLQEQLQSVDIKNGSVSAKITITKGTKFGPFVGKFSTEPIDRRFAWEVSSNDLCWCSKNYATSITTSI